MLPKSIKTFIAIATVVFAPLWLYARTPADTLSIVGTINASGNIRIDQPAAMAPRLARVATSAPDEADEVSRPHTQASHAGYRVLIYDDNNPRTARRNAEAYNARVAAQFPGLRTYISFNSPYWQVKAGDFRSRAEAEAAMAEIRHAFPGIAAYLRVIRDRINITD